MKHNTGHHKQPRGEQTTHSAKAHDNRGRKPEKTRDDGGAQRKGGKKEKRKKKRTEHREAATKTTRHKRGGEGGSNHLGAAHGQAANTKEARAHSEPRSGRPTKRTTHSVKSLGTPGRKPEKARDSGGRDNGDKQRKRKQTEHRAAATKTAKEKGEGGGGAATTREQPGARRDTQTRRDRTESREAGGQQNKQHAALRPRAPGAGKKQKPKRTGAHNERKKNKNKNRAARSSDETARHKRGGGGATTREQPAARRETQTGRERTKSPEAGGQQNKQHTARSRKAPRAGNEGMPETKGAHKKGKKRPQAGGGGGKKNNAPRPKAAAAEKPKKARDKGVAEKKKKKEGPGGKTRGGQTKDQDRSNPSPEGAEQGRQTERPQDMGGRTKTRPREPARPPRPGRTSTGTHARDPGFASSDPQGEVSASIQNSPGALAESPVARWTVCETGRVSDRVHTRQPAQRRQPKTNAAGTRQGQPHRRAPNEYDAERGQGPCLGGGQRQAQSARFLASLRVPRAAAQ